jgi:hypothetical protein
MAAERQQAFHFTNTSIGKKSHQQVKSPFFVERPL